ncbi:hypothetical protein L218DRAFT_1073705 [Marasmius fiardii PR-910]|nr:hypothetical protein L218DRAFT_1073705 [Marasmius fiardii PR-910]
MVRRKREEDEGELYQVEVILGARVTDDGEWEYEIRWAGFDDPKYDTWEPQENIEKTCKRLLARLWENIGSDNNDYFPGYICRPTDDWIQEEKEKFWNDEKKKKRGKGPKSKKQKTSASGKRKESEETPSSVASSSKAKAKKVVAKQEPQDNTADLSPKRKTRANVIVVDSNSDSDEPLMTRRSTRVAATKPKTRSTSRILRKNKQDATKKPEIAVHRSPSPSGSLFSETEGPRRSSDTAHAVSVSPPKLQPSKPSVQRPSKPADLKVRIPSETEPSISSPSTKPTTSARSNTNTPNIPNKLPSFFHVPSQATASGSNLSVKSRLYQDAITPVPTNSKNASISSASSTVKASPAATTKKSTLNNLNFKKKPAAVQASPTITLNTRVPSLSSPDRSPDIPSTIPSFTTGPTSPVNTNKTRIPGAANDPTMAALNAAPPSPSLPQMADPPITSPSAFMRPGNSMDQTSTLVNVDSFLQTVMPPEMAAPFETAPVENNDDAMSLPARISLSGSATITGDIRRRWKWTGGIEIHAGEELPRQVLCEVSITDPIPFVQGGMPFRVVFPEDKKSIAFQTFLPVYHLEDVLMACKAEGAARLISADDSSDRLRQFAGYLQYNKLVAISPVNMDSIHTANLICIPSSALKQIERHVQVPAELATTETGALVVVLSSWVLPREQQLNNDWHEFIHDRDESEVEYLVSDQRFLKVPETKCTVGILGYPQWLHNFLRPREYQRTYSIFTGFQPEPNATVELETNLLESILGRYESAKPAPIESEDISRIIFIHAQGLDKVSQIPLLRKRRETVETMFVVFGTLPPNVPEVEYPLGLWEIYPIGGVVTFTAKALLRHPDVILEKTQAIAEYDLWTCYIIPTVLGMAATLFYKDKDESPLEAFDRDDFAYQFLLDAIYEGEVGLLRYPPPVSNVTTTHWMSTDEHGDPVIYDRHRKQEDDNENWRDRRSEWFSDQIDSLFRNRRQTLEFCLNAFQWSYGNVSPHLWDSVLVDEIGKDLKNMQIQPAIATVYRRFVVLKAEGEKDFNDELEWMLPETLDVYTELATPPPESSAL